MQLINSGTITKIQDGIIYANGLSQAGINELVYAVNDKGEEIPGLVLNLEKEEVGIIGISSVNSLHTGNKIYSKAEEVSLAVSSNLLGRVIDPLGNPLDEKGEIDHKEGKQMPLQVIAPGVMARKDVERPLLTGIKSIDAMIPIGKGQRELIIGDRQTGKTAIALDTIINQKDNPINKTQVKCIYVAIGQKVSKVAQLVKKLEENGALDYSVIVVAGAADSAALQYLAPLTGTAIGEYFANNGEDALIIYDDLTKHAWAYREISLLLKRPPGREAYPGDIFYLHSSLLERSVQYSDKQGGGSLTSLPIIETQEGDVSAYIPTNIISITDGQIYLEADLFNAGIKPAINVGLSVSRVGGAAQTKIMKKIAGQLRLDLAQYRELEAFAQFGSDLDEVTKQKLLRGEKIVELLKQDQYSTLPLPEQIILIYAGTQGFIDEISTNKISSWEDSLLFKFRQEKKLRKQIETAEKLDDKLKTAMDNFISEFNQQFV